MPTLYQAVLLANEAGCIPYNEIKNADRLSSWSLRYNIFDFKPRLIERFGYVGKTFVNEQERKIVITHRGTKIDNLNTIGVTSECTSNLFSDSCIASKSSPFETLFAMEFTQLSLSELARQLVDFDQYEVIHVGHSLGGVHAHLCAFQFDQVAITFDTPGYYEIIKKIEHTEPLVKLTPDDLIATSPSKHVTFQSENNFINQCNTNFGVTYQLKTERTNTWLNTATNHKLQFLIQAIEQSTEKDNDPTLADFSTPAQFKKIDSMPVAFQAIPKRPIQIDRTSHSYSCYQSELFEVKHGSREIVTMNHWVVAHANLGDPLLGHSVIIVEGLRKDKAGNPQAFVGYFHLMLPSENRIDKSEEPMLSSDPSAPTQGIVKTNSFNFHLYKKRYKADRMNVYPCERIDAENMIKAIQESAKQPVDYHWAGINTWYSSTSHNCTTWAMDKLEVAKIHEKVKKTSKITPATQLSTCTIL